MKFAGYGRVSTAKDAQLESLTHQIEFFSQFAAAHNHQLYRVYADEGISGKQVKNRREFQQMMEDAKHHLFDMVVVKDISRFARNTVDLLNAVRELRNAGIEVQFLSNNQTVLGNSEFIITIFGALAQEESASLSKRVKFGKRINAQRGRVPHHIYGYRQLDTFHLEIVVEEARVIREMYERLVERGEGTRKISMALNEQGERTKEGALWRPTTIRRVIKNPIYGGVLETNKTETIDFITGQRKVLPQKDRFSISRPELQIVSPEIWSRANLILQQRAVQNQPDTGKEEATVSGRYSAKHLFSTLIRCKECGYSYARRQWSSQKSGKVYFWACSGRNNFTSVFCKNASTLGEQALIAALESYFLSRIGDNPKFVQRVLASVDQILEPKGLEQAGCDNDQKERLALARRERRFQEMYANDLISLEEVKERLAELQEKGAAMTRLSTQRQEGQASLAALREQVGRELAQREQWINLSEWTNWELRRLVEQIVVTPQGEVTVYLKRLEEAGV